MKTPPVILSIVWLLCAALLMGCSGRKEKDAATSRDEIQVGLSKTSVLNAYDVPDEFHILRNGQLTVVTYSSNPLANCERTQSTDERWMWSYKDGLIVVLEQDHVVGIQKTKSTTP